jgi:hypothetical protein
MFLRAKSLLESGILEIQQSVTDALVTGHHKVWKFALRAPFRCVAVGALAGKSQ